MYQNDWKKCLWVIPLTLLVLLNGILGAPEDTPVTVLLAGQIFSNVSMGGMTMFVLTMDNLLFLVLFNALFGTYIFNHFFIGSVYEFSRIANRKNWTLKKILELARLDAFYTLLYILLNTGVACKRSLSGIDRETLECIIFLSVFVFLLLLVSTLAINFLSIRLGIVRGFFIVYVGIICLILLAVSENTPALIRFFNPMNCLHFLWMGFREKGLLLLNHVLWLFLVCYFGIRSIMTKDLLILDNSL